MTLKKKVFIFSACLKNFNKTFRKDVTFDNIKVKKEQGFTLTLKNVLLKKTTKGVKMLPPDFLGLAKKLWSIGENEFDA